MALEDNFKTIEKTSEGLFKDRGSKFFGYALPMTDESELKEFIDQLKKEHHNARHFCYAFRINPEDEYYRANDDGEPSNSAGTPILNQILSSELYNIGIVVVRYFGGTKLGVPGLINAYKMGAVAAIENAKLIDQVISKKLIINCEYQHLNEVMRIIKREDLSIDEQKMGLDCTLTMKIPKSEFDHKLAIFEKLHMINIDTE